MAYKTVSKKRTTTRSNNKRRSSSARINTGRMSATRKATEAAFRRGVKSGMRMRRSGSRRSYIYS